jgi:hypothetical protein
MSESVKVTRRFSGGDGSYEEGDSFTGTAARIAELRKLGLLEPASAAKADDGGKAKG